MEENGFELDLFYGYMLLMTVLLTAPKTREQERKKVIEFYLEQQSAVDSSQQFRGEMLKGIIWAFVVSTNASETWTVVAVCISSYTIYLYVQVFECNLSLWGRVNRVVLILHVLASYYSCHIHPKRNEAFSVWMKKLTARAHTYKDEHELSDSQPTNGIMIDVNAVAVARVYFYYNCAAGRVAPLHPHRYSFSFSICLETDSWIYAAQMTVNCFTANKDNGTEKYCCGNASDGIGRTAVIPFSDMVAPSVRACILNCQAMFDARARQQQTTTKKHWWKWTISVYLLCLHSNRHEQMAHAYCKCRHRLTNFR